MLGPVITTLLAFFGVLAASQLAGTALLRLSGWNGSRAIAGPVGLGVLTSVAGAALHVPGGAFAVGACIFVGLAAAAALLWRTGSRPVLALSDAVAAAPALAIAVAPLVILGRTGIFGVSLNNDMAAHLITSDAYRFADVFASQGLAEGYPTGPHAMVAVFGALFGGGTAEIFTGFTMATFVLAAVATLAFVRDAPAIGRAALVLFAGSSFLLAAYFVQGSFKEMMLASFVMATGALFVPGTGVGRTRWLPLAAIGAGTLGVYSYGGLAWILPLVGCWFAIRFIQEWSAGQVLSKGKDWVRENFVPAAMAAGVFVVLIIPQAPRVLDFFRAAGLGTNVEGSPLGNLAGPLPFWEAFGVWGSGDYRYVPADSVAAGAWAGLMLALALMGAVWLIRRGTWVVVLMAVMTALVWLYIENSQTPYLAAKGLVILSPMVGLLVVLPFVERDGWFRSTTGWWKALAVAVAASIAWGASTSIAGAVRSVRFGPLDHIEELRTFSRTVGRSKVLFLGNDDFLRWILPNASLSAPFIGLPNVEMRPEKKWAYAQVIDIDAIPNDQINTVDFLIAPRDPVASQLPSQFHQVARTKSFTLYKRVGSAPNRLLLQEGADAAKVLNCRSGVGRALLRRPLLAATRMRSQSVALPAIESGRSVVVKIPLPHSGRWRLSLQYTSARSVSVAAGDQRWAMPANMDRPGARFILGTVEAPTSRSLSVTINAKGGWLSRRTDPVAGALFATPVAAERLVPVADACGKPVDYLVHRRG